MLVPHASSAWNARQLIGTPICFVSTLQKNVKNWQQYWWFAVILHSFWWNFYKVELFLVDMFYRLLKIQKNKNACDSSLNTWIQSKIYWFLFQKNILPTQNCTIGPTLPRTAPPASPFGDGCTCARLPSYPANIKKLKYSS